MATSEIDDIFSGKVTKSTASAKGKGKKAADDLPPSSSTLSPKKKKSKKRKRLEGEDGHKDSATTTELAGRKTDKGRDNAEGDDDTSEKKAKTKRPRVVETVQDPSVTHSSSSAITPSSKQTKEKSRKKKINASNKEEEKDGDDLERFRDSRGTAPRTFSRSNITRV